MAQLLIPLRFREFDENGDPLAGGKLYTYLAGTTTPAATYTDSAGAVPNANPVILDANGRAQVRLSASTNYKFVLKDSNDVTIYTEDNVTANTVSGSSEAGAWIEHAIAASLTNYVLTGETIDGSLYSSAVYDYEMIIGTVALSNGTFSVQRLNSVWRISTGLAMAQEAHSMTFSLSDTGATTAQLRVSTGASPSGLGTLKLSKRLVPV